VGIHAPEARAVLGDPVNRWRTSAQRIVAAVNVEA
jgi:hypothetical protein